MPGDVIGSSPGQLVAISWLRGTAWVTVCEFPEVSDEAIIVAAHGFGKTMIATDLVHQVILAGHSAASSARRT